MKKKKLTYNSLAMSTLKNRKKSYALMIIGIVLSMIFSSSIIYFIFCAYSTSQEQDKANKGLFDMYCNKYDKTFFEEAYAQDAIEVLGKGSVLGFAFTDEEDKFNGTSLVKLDKVAKDLVNPIFISGSYPTKKGEIAIEQTTLLQLGLSPKVGDEITLKFQVQNDDELIPEIKEKTYKLTGILKDKRSNLPLDFNSKTILPSAFVSEYEEVDLGGKENTVAYCTLTKTGYFTMYDLIYVSDLSLNLDFCFRYYEPFNLETDEGISLLYILIIVAVLLLASSIGIINALTTNLKERKKLIGMYRAVGATHRQIRNIFVRESIILGLICTPVSLAISFVAVKAIVSNIFEEAFFKPNILVLLACGTFSMICVIVASFIPLFSTSKITPMQAIRNIEITRKFKNKKIKTQREFTVPKLLAKRNLIISKRKQTVVSIFLVVTIVFSSYILSNLTYEINNIYTLDYDYSLYLSADFGYYAVNRPEGNNGFSENHIQTVLMNENIKAASGYREAVANILIDDPSKLSDYRFITNADYAYDSERVEEVIPELTESNYRRLLNPISMMNIEQKNSIIKAAGYNGDFSESRISAYDEEVIKELNDYVFEGRIDINKLNSGEQVIMCAPKEVFLTIYTDDYGPNLFTYTNKENLQSDIDQGENIEIIATEECDYKVGEKINLSILYSDGHDSESETGITKDNVEVNNKQVEIGAIMYDMSNKVHMEYLDSGIITTTQGMEHFLPKAKYKHVYFELKEGCSEEIDKEVSSILKSIADSVDRALYESNYEYQISQKESLKDLTALILSVLILLFTICGSIINNTIAANVKEDKKKIGTLRAVGANETAISKSYIIQLVSMFKWGFGIGFGLFFLSYFVLFITNKYTGFTDALIFNPWITLLFSAVLFIVCSLNIYLKIRKEIKSSIVENIREL